MPSLGRSACAASRRSRKDRRPLEGEPLGGGPSTRRLFGPSDYEALTPSARAEIRTQLESPDVTISGLRLTSPTGELAEQFLTWRHRPDVTRWFMQQRIEDTEEYVADWAAYDDHDHHRVVAVLNGAMVGQATLGVVDGMGQSGNEAEFVGREGRLSYFVHPDHAGRGIATALARDALANAFGRLGLRRVQAGCFADNVASWRVMEKLGMRREQHGVKDSFHAEFGWVDGYTYALLAEEWRE